MFKVSSVKVVITILSVGCTDVRACINYSLNSKYLNAEGHTTQRKLFNS